jgi:hypothetical protein
VSSHETFEFAAAIAGVSIGLAAVLILSILAIIGSWQLFRRANEAASAATRAALSTEDLVRRLTAQPGVGAGEGQFGELRRQSEALVDQQRRLQDMARNLLDNMAIEGSAAAPAAIQDLEGAIGRLDATVGQMAASLANLIQQLERQQRG